MQMMTKNSREPCPPLPPILHWGKSSAVLMLILNRFDTLLWCFHCCLNAGRDSSLTNYITKPKPSCGHWDLLFKINSEHGTVTV